MPFILEIKNKSCQLNSQHLAQFTWKMNLIWATPCKRKATKRETKGEGYTDWLPSALADSHSSSSRMSRQGESGKVLSTFDICDWNTCDMITKWYFNMHHALMINE